MTRIVFWEKPGCMGNARQKALLATGGHVIESRSLPGSKWEQADLLAFLESHPVPDWFNRGARRVKEGEVDPDAVSREQALEILIADPILIRRPLLEIEGTRLMGFDLAKIETLIGALPSTERIERVRGENLEKCPGEETGVSCGTVRE
ncbi:MAG: hypothetical protein RL318_2657 [Fibrobacterota bacterium]|jgi:nitrogenase-associated protein